MPHSLSTDDSAGFWDRIAPRYATTPVADIPTYEKKLALTGRHLSPDSRVLEVGCGTGGTALFHARHVKHLLATDISGQMIRIAKNRQSSQRRPNVEFRQAALTDVDPSDGPFDAVLGLNVLHLIPNYRECIDQAHTLLSSGGVFVSSTVCLGRASLLRLVLPLPAALGLVPKVVYIDAAQLKKEIESAGFEIIERMTAGRNLFLIGKKK